MQGGQGRIFAYWAIIFFRQFFENYRLSKHFWAIFSPRKKIFFVLTHFWVTLWAIFSKTHLAILVPCYPRCNNCDQERDLIRVARCFLFKPKVPIWVNFGGPKIGKCWYIYGYLEYLTDIWYIFPVWVIFTEKNLATLDFIRKMDRGLHSPSFRPTKSNDFPLLHTFISRSLSVMMWSVACKGLFARNTKVCVVWLQFSVVRKN
jgi:hypothetical protein